MIPSVTIIPDASPVVLTVGGVHAKLHSRQHKQPPTNKETSDAVTCQNKKSAECMIGTASKPAIKKTHYVKRNIVEFCCGEHSKIGQSKYQRDCCSVTRLTLDDGVTTNQGLHKAFEAVRYDKCFLWTSIPCTGGSRWQNINSKKLGGPEWIKEYKRLFTKIRASFKNCDKGMSQTWRSNSHRMAEGL